MVCSNLTHNLFCTAINRIECAWCGKSRGELEGFAATNLREQATARLKRQANSQHNTLSIKVSEHGAICWAHPSHAVKDNQGTEKIFGVASIADIVHTAPVTSQVVFITHTT